MFGEFTKDTKLMYIAGYEAAKEYQEGGPVRRTAPKIKLLVNPFVPPFLPLEFVSKDASGHIETYSFSKARNQSHGDFSVVLQGDDKEILKNVGGFPVTAIWKKMGGNPSVEDIFKPPILAQLWVEGYHVMTGRLMIRRKKTVKSGSGWTKKYTLEFEELGALYEEQILKSFFNYVSEDLLIINNPAKAIDAAALAGSGMVNLSTSLGLYVQAFIASTLAYGLAGFPAPYLSGSDLLPLALRLVALPAPLGCISNMSLVTQLVTSTSMFSSNAGSFWSFLKTLIPEPFMELSTESGGRTICTGKLIPASGLSSSSLGSGVNAVLAGNPVPVPIPGLNATPMLPGFNYLICRTSPYDNPLIGLSPWHPVLAPFTMGVFDLITAGDFIIITDKDLVQKDLGVSGKQQYTLFHANMTGRNASVGAANGDIGRPSIASGPLLPMFPGGIRSWGHRIYEAGMNATSTAWAGLVGQSIQRFTRKFLPGTNIRSLSTLLNYWFRNAAKFREGTIVTRPIPYARPGMSLLYLPTLTGHLDDPRDIGIYYIDNISTSGTIGAGGTTSFTVIRGTPIPNSLTNLLSLMLDWEIIPPGFNFTDGEVGFNGL